MNKQRIAKVITKYGTMITLGLIIIGFSLFVDGFAAPKNLVNILKQIALLTVIAEGFTMCLIVDELDLSFANIACLSGIISGGLILAGQPTIIAIIVPLLVGFAFGLASGLLVTKVGISSLITTLAMSILATGLTYWITGGVSFYGEMPSSFLMLGRGYFLGIPSLILIMLVTVVISHILINKTKTGIYLQATGANKEATKLSGVNTDVYKVLALIICSVAASFAGVLLTSKLGAANPEAASGYMMDTFAAALLGTTVLSIGLASPIGTFIGALMIGVLNNGMTLAGAQYFMQDIIKGIIIILSVSIASSQARKLARN
ncbi:MAG: ABC transporter permease [Sphaerochaeta sp.]|nr:ABC transporter permease [Sphaerochaeta sp.]